MLFLTLAVQQIVALLQKLLIIILVVKGYMTTTRAFTSIETGFSTQRSRRARSITAIIPTKTGALAMGKVLPKLNGN